jgi:hypothetical protein
MIAETERDAAATDGGDESDENDREASERLERVVAVVSIAFTVLLLSFVLWQGATTGSGAIPTATVERVESPPHGDGGPERLRVTVRLENQGEGGIESATVAVECGDARRTVQVTHVPGDGHKTATVTCPVGTTPTAAVESWTDY